RGPARPVLPTDVGGATRPGRGDQELARLRSGGRARPRGRDLGAVSGLRGWIKQLRVFARKQRVEADLDEELAVHIEMETEKNIREGMEPAEARRSALVEFGGIERTKERVRDARWTRWLEDAATDVRYAIRSLARTPMFTAVATLTLAL